MKINNLESIEDPINKKQRDHGKIITATTSARQQQQ
jgi:hypothetical protein